MITKLKNKVTLQISVGITLILFLLTTVGVVMIACIHQLSSITTDIYKHPFMVNNSALMVRFNIEHMRDHMLEIALSKDSTRAESLGAELAALESSTMDNFEEVETNFVGDPAKVAEASHLLSDWRDARIRTIDLARLGLWDQVTNVVSNANAVTFAQLSANMDDIIKRTRHNAEELTKQANSESTMGVGQMEWLLAMAATTIVIIGLVLLRLTWHAINDEEKAAEAINRSTKSYRSLFGNMLEGYAHCRMIYENGSPMDFTYLDVNDSFERLTGLRYVIRKNISEVIPGIGESNPELLEIFGRVASTGIPEQFETFINPLGMWLSISVYSTEKGHFVTVFNNITERKDRERQLRLSASIFQASSEAMLITDSMCNIISVNPAFTEITGYSADEALGRHPRQLSAGHHDDAFYQEILHSLATSNHWEGEIWDTKKNGDAYALRLIISAIPDNTGAVLNYAGQFVDITGKKRMDDTLSNQANFDHLTGLANRRMFRDLLEQEIKKSRRSNNKLALLFIDLDQFKEVNDTLGHHVGDQLLVEAANRIVSCVRESDIVSRLGGDEFTVILSEITEVNRIENVAHAILQSLCKPFLFESREVVISASIGITIYPTDATAPSDLLRYADQAMYLSKSEGRNCFHFFTNAMQEATRKHHQLAQDLHGALHGNQFQCYYQPIVDLKTGAILKAETLLRWLHPTLGVIAPTDFIPIAEEIGLIDEIGDWIFTKSIEQAKLWTKVVGSPFRIGVNISPAQLTSNKYNNVWINHVREIKLPEKIISIDITEGTLLKDRPEVAETLLAVHDAGIEVAVDDFGTGYSSLSYLQQLKIDQIKIGLSFIQNLKPGSTELSLSEAIIVVAHKLGMKVIAKGIETSEQRDLLIAAGCDFGQGYLFSKPVPSREFEELLQGKSDFDIHSVNERIATEQQIRFSANTHQHRRHVERRNIKRPLGRREMDLRINYIAQQSIRSAP